MHRSTIRASLLLTGLVLLAGCGSPPANTSGTAASASGSADRKADAPMRANRAGAVRSLEALEAAIAEAHAAVASASPHAATATREARLHLSETRRAIVAADVALQKAREALGREDYAAVRQATLGVAEHLTGIFGKLRP